MSDSPFRTHTFARKFPFVFPRCYVLGKVLADPVYAAVFEVLRLTREPLLDAGCGIGVLAFYLRERRWQPPCTCVDVDGRKIALAQRIQHLWPGTFDFHAGDAVNELPTHHGSVTLLDMLQYLPREAQKTMLLRAAERVSPGGVLVIRNAMSGSGGRHGITKLTDWFARWCRWMGMVPRHYPDAEDICGILAEHGLHGEFKPLWGRTPFHNWLGVFRRDEPH
jgi:SAM-dependent methyltransferase